MNQSYITNNMSFYSKTFINFFVENGDYIIMILLLSCLFKALLIIFGNIIEFKRQKKMQITNFTNMQITNFTNRMKKFSKKIHKTEEFDDLFCDFSSYNKSKKEGKNFTYNYVIKNAVKIDIDNKEHFVITGKYYNYNLSFIFGTKEFYDDYNYNGIVLYNGHSISIDRFIEMEGFKFINKKILCEILNLYYDKFDGFNDEAFWHE